MNDPLPALLDDLVVANRVLARYGVLDGFGHVSARHPPHADRFLPSRSRAPELVEAADITTFDLDSNALGGDAVVLMRRRRASPTRRSAA